MSPAIIAVDVGTKRIGLAIAEGVYLPAMPLTTIEHQSRAKDVRRVRGLAIERGAGTIVVGYPLALDGSRGPAADSVDRFIQELRGIFSGDVVAVDERMTTGAATKRLLQSGLRPSRRRELVDRIAAVEILESYLAQRRSERSGG